MKSFGTSLLAILIGGALLLYAHSELQDWKSSLARNREALESAEAERQHILANWWSYDIGVPGYLVFKADGDIDEFARKITDLLGNKPFFIPLSDSEDDLARTCASERAAVAARRKASEEAEKREKEREAQEAAQESTARAEANKPGAWMFNGGYQSPLERPAYRR